MKTVSQSHWRDSARSVRFFIWDGKTAFALLLCLLHIRLWTFMIAIAALLFFSLLNRFGFTPEIFVRWLRTTLAGARKPAMMWWQKPNSLK